MDYIHNDQWKNITKKYNYMSVCSKNELNKKKNINNIKYTTDEDYITSFINKNSKKIICITYQSLELWIH